MVKEFNAPPINGFSNEFLENVYEKSRDNREALMASEQCACFYCKSIFKPTDIAEWEKSGYDHKEIGLCPHCMMDSLLGSSQIELKPELIEALRLRYHFNNESPELRQALSDHFNVTGEKRGWICHLKKWTYRQYRQIRWWIMNGFHRRMHIYYISSIRIIPKDKRETYANGVEKSPFDQREWGFYRSRRVAMKAVRQNWTDLQEHYYRYCVIEKKEEGIYGETVDHWCFEWDNAAERWVELPSPPVIVAAWYRRNHIMFCSR